MINSTIEHRLREQLDRLPADQQRCFLDLEPALAVRRPRGTAGQDLMHFAGTQHAADARKMIQANEEGCEQVNVDNVGGLSIERW